MERGHEGVCMVLPSAPTRIRSHRGHSREPMRPQEAHVGKKVRVSHEHSFLERRGMVGQVVGCYGGEEYVAVDVRFGDGCHRLFWPEDLEEITPPQSSWWRSLLGKDRSER